MEHKKLLFTLLMLTVFLLYSMSTKAASDSATVDVTIQAVSQITLSPPLLTWTVQPGQAGSPSSLDITNTGSLNVTNIYAYVDTLTDESTRPYGSTNATDYAAGGVIVFKNETLNEYFFAGRIEWNSTEDISNMVKTGVTSPVAWGFFRNTSYEYNWLLGNGTDGYCNNTGAQFAIEDDVDNGTAATRTPTTTNINMDGGDENYGYFSINRATAPLYGSCVAASYDCTKIYIYAYDKRSGFDTCANSRYIQESDLAPKQVHTLTLNVYVPLGIPNGTMNTSTFTVYAS